MYSAYVLWLFALTFIATLVAMYSRGGRVRMPYVVWINIVWVALLVLLMVVSVVGAIFEL